MSDSTAPIRSYQRIFRPERRLYQIDGRRLPVPGGIPLEWLGWSLAALVAVLVFSQRSVIFAAALGGLGALFGASSHGWRGVAVVGACAFLGTLVVGVLLGWLDWPLRLIVLPGLVATIAGHPSGDGRSTHRYLVSWLAVQFRVARRSLDRPLTADGEVQLWAPRVWVAPDHHSPVLEHGRVHGPARLVFGRSVVAVPARGRLVVRPADGHLLRHGEQTVEVIELVAGQVIEVRP